MILFRSIIPLLFILFATENAFLQEKDTLKKIDTLKTSTLDTTRHVISDIDAIIEYNAEDSVVFNLLNDQMLLYNTSQVLYKDLKLNSGIIILDRKTQILEAIGIKSDSAGTERYSQTPIMYQGNEKFEGFKLTYSFESQRGTISMGYSDAEIGYYYGEKIKKVTPEVVFIRDGIYTTSTDKIDPEYYFFSPKMKVIPKDRVIAQSVFLYIEGVPVFWIPFAVLPNRSGRSSGFMVPTYGIDNAYGLYLANFGYFWAINDYFDLALKASVFSKGRFDFSGRVRYAKKYNYSGSIEGGYGLIRKGVGRDPDKFSSDQWAISVIHNQKLTPTSNIDANITFASGKSYYDNTTNSLSTLLRQNIISNFTYSKYWDDSPFSLSFNYYRDQNLQTNDVNERIPALTFNMSEIYPFRKGTGTADNSKFYDFISVSYSGVLRNERTELTPIFPDGTTGPTNKNVRNGILNTVNLTYSPPSSSINIRPYIGYVEIWYSKYITKNLNPLDSSLIINENNAIKAVRYFQTGITFNTKLIGIFNPKIFNIKGIRHTMLPSISYNYRPDFSQEKWGYYDYYTDRNGNRVKYSYYEQNLFGTAPAGEVQSLSFSFNNILEMKTRVNDTLDNKFQLINFNFSGAYNFSADSLKFSEIFADFRTQIGSILNIGGNARFNLYEFDAIKQTRVNKFLLSQGKFFDITGFNINASTSFSLGIVNPGRPEETPGKDTLFNRPNYQSYAEDVSYNIPFTGGLNFNYSVANDNPGNPIKSSNLSANLAFSPSQNWRFTFTAGYDIINKQVTAPYITAYRDLKSWEINFNWYPIGTYRGFFLEIRIKAPQLRDLKITKQTNTRGVY